MVASLIPFILLAINAAAQTNRTNPPLIGRICGQNRTNDAETFDINFVDTMENIARQVALDGFGVATAGANTMQQAYGLGQCFDYLSSVDCRLCYVESRVKLPRCLPANSARVFLDGCFLAYAYYNLSRRATDAMDTSVCGSSKNQSGSRMFTSATSELIKSLTSKADSLKHYYMVGQAEVSSRRHVYGMAQCWRSLDVSGCRQCLEKARESILQCLPSTDGSALNAGCFVRYSTEMFYAESSQKRKHSSVFLRVMEATLASILALILILLLVILFWKRRLSSEDRNVDAASSEVIRSITDSHLGFKYQTLKEATNNFDQGNMLGRGGYGTVYKGVLKDDRAVAVKRLFFSATQFVDQFYSEINLVSQVQHKNLIKLLGCSVEGHETLLVYEYLPKTSLDRFLFDTSRKVELNWTRRFDIIIGIAEGLAYLHESCQIRIIHRDVKAANILLDEKFRPKIADFGLARYFAEGRSHLSTGIAGTLGYMAPEYILHGQLSEKADVYSYGVLVLEILTGRRNSSESMTGQSFTSLIWSHYTSTTLHELVDPYLEGQCSKEQIHDVFRIGLLCTQASPSLRPSMRKVVEMLTIKAMDLPLPTQPPFISLRGTEVRGDESETSSGTSSSSRYPFSTSLISSSLASGR